MNIKLIVLANSKHMKFYKSTGFKLKELTVEHEAKDFAIEHKHKRLRDEFNQRASSPSHYFDPRTEAKNIERNKFCRKLINQLESIYNQDNFNEIIIAAEPKTLGEIRSILSPKIKSLISKEIPKDLIKSTAAEIASHVFA